MRSPRFVRAEHKAVCQAMRELLNKGDGHSPLPKDTDLYCSLAIVKKTLEWVHPLLIKTTAKGPDRLNELMGHRHYACGATHAVLYP